MTTEQITSITSGFTFSVGYVLLKIEGLDFDSFIELLALLVKTSIVGILGGFCGLLGKEIFNKLKEKWNK